VVISISADYLSEVLPGAQQTPESKKSVVDETFQKIFSSIQETSRQINDKIDNNKANDKNISGRDRDTTLSRNETDQAARKDDERINDIKEPVSDKDENQENRAGDERSQSDELAQSGDKVVIQEKPADDKTEDEKLTEEGIKEKVLKLLKQLTSDSSQMKDGDKNLTSLEKTASIIAKRLFALSKSDPSAFEKLMEDISKFSFKDKSENPGQAIAQILKLIKTVSAQNQESQNQDNKNIEALLNKALKQVEKTDPAPEDKQAGLKDFSEKGEKRADGQPFDKAIDAGKDSRTNAKTANNKDAFSQQAASKQAISNETVNPAKDQVKADVKPGALKITNNMMGEANPAPGNSSKTANADQPQVNTKFTSREVFQRTMIDQIVRKARINVRANGVSNMVIQIDPPNLGKVDIRISVHDNIVKAYLIADNPEVRSIIENNLDNLKNSMNNQGLKVDQINVSTQQAYTQDRNETQGNDFGSDSNRDNQRHTSRADDAQGMEGEMTTAQARALAHDGILSIVA